MKKSGFTLIEIIAVLAVLALVSVIAIPKAIGTIAASRQESLTAMAKTAINTAKLYVSTDTDGTFVLPEAGNAKYITFLTMGLDFDLTPYGDQIDKNNSYVFVNSTGDYYVTMTTTVNKKGLKNIKETALNSDYKVIKFESDDNNHLGVPDVENTETLYLDNNGDGVLGDATLVLSPNYIEFGASTPNSGDSLSSTLIVDIKYIKSNTKSVVLTVNGLDYYVYGAEAGTSNTKVLRSCKEIAIANSAAIDGKYYVTIDGTVNDTWCDISDGWMLLDNFTTRLGENTSVTPTAALGVYNITDKATHDAAGWIYDGSRFLFAETYAGFLNINDGYTYTVGSRKTLPSYTDNYKLVVDKSGGRSGTTNDGMWVYKNTTLLAYYAPLSGKHILTGTYVAGDYLKCTEVYAGFGMGELWVKESANTLSINSSDPKYNIITYDFLAATTGIYDFNATINYLDGKSYSTETRTITKN